MRQSNPIAILNHAYLTEYNFVKFMFCDIILWACILFIWELFQANLLSWGKR